MWKQIEIEEKSFFYECKIVKNFVKFILYDLKHSWCENIELQVLLDRARELNKRIQYDELTIEATLLAADAVEAKIIQIDGDELQTLQLKYRINTHPFHFKWQLREQTDLEFREAVTIPLFMAVHGLCQQMEELRDVISKKDTELQQYILEGAILRRTTVATQSFNFTEFAEKHAEVNKVTEGFQQIAGHVMAQKETAQKLTAGTEIPKGSKTDNSSSDPKSSNCKESVNAVKKNSPRSRKRKTLEIQQKHMEMKLNARKQKLEYESSQSQSLSDSPPDIDIISQELAAIQNSLRVLEQQRLDDLRRRSDSSLSLSN